MNCTPASDGASLATAIDQINAGSCDTINVTGYIALASQDLPVIDRAGATITIQGSGGPQIVDGTGTSRLFAVINGDVTISDLNIENGLAKGGDGGSDNGGGGGAGGALGAGGGLFVGAGATVTLENVDLGGNTAQGGDGGDATDTTFFGGGGGGGGLNGGAGGSGSTSNRPGGKGGGGAFGADGGGMPAVATQGGGGGGGGGNGATPGAPGGGGNGGGSGGLGGGGAGADGNSGDDGSAGIGMGGGGGGGGSGQPGRRPGDGGDGGALGGGGGGGAAVGPAPNTGPGGSGGNGGFGGGGGGGGQILETDPGNWAGGDGGLGGFGAGGGGGGSAYGVGSATPVASAGGAGGFLGGAGGASGANSGVSTGGGGGGGAGLGGAIFVQNGGTLNIGQNVFFGGAGANAVAGGTGGSAGPDAVDGEDGSAGGSAGANIYAIDGAAGLGSNATVGFAPGSGQTIVLTDADLGMLQAGYSGQLRKSGAGELVLQSTSGMTTGGWSVVAGILRGNTDNLIGAIANDGQLILDQSFNGTLAGDLTGSGSLVKNQAGNLILSGDNDAYTGDIQINAGTLTVNGSGIGDTSAVTFGGGTQFTVGAAGETIGSLAGSANVSLGGNLTVGGNNGSTTFDGNLSGSGSLTKTGSGYLFLASHSSYTGGTTIDAGTLYGTTASLIGAIVNNSALVFYQPFDGTHAGAISGSGSLTKSGTGTLTLSGSNSYTGGTTIDAGTLVGTTSSLIGAIVNNGALEFDQAFDGTFSGDISGAGGLTKSGSGAVTLSGTNSYSGATTVTAGTLSVNGALASSVNVASGARLTGSGSVGQTMTQGIVAPGTSIGTMSVTGDLTLAPGSVLEVEFDDAGNADRIVVTGTVTLGGTLRLLPTVGSYVTNTQYLIIDAAAVGGSFAASETINETRLGGLQSTVTVTADQVLLELTSASFGGGAGAGSGPVADYLDELRPGATGDLADVIAELEVLPLEQIDEALQSLSPQTVDAVPTVQAAYGRVLTDVMERRLQGLRSGTFGEPFPAGLNLAPTPQRADNHSTGSLAAAMTPTSLEEGLLALVDMAEQSGSILEVGDAQERLWLQLIGEVGRRKDEAEFLGYQYQLLGVISGFEHRLSPEWQVGATVALGHSEVDFDRDRGGNEGMSYAGGAYLGWTPQPGVAVDLLGWAGLTRVDSQRNVEFGGVEREAEGETDVRSLGVELRGELSKDWQALHLTGFAAASYTSNWQDDYCETGAGSVNLCVEAMHTSEVAGEIGGGVSYDVELGGGALTIDVQAAVTARQPLDDRAIRSGFDGQAGGFTIPGDDDGELGLSPRVGLIYHIDDQLSLSAQYSGHFGQNTTAHSVQAGLSFRF